MVGPQARHRGRADRRALLSHDDGGFRERGFAGSLTFDPRPDSELGLRVTLRQTVGASATGGMDALLGRETLAGLAANDNADGSGDDDLKRRRLELKLGYGLAAFGDRFTATPEIGLALSDSDRELSLGWRLGFARRGPTSLELKLEASRRESVNPGSGAGAGYEAEHGVGFRLTARW